MRTLLSDYELIVPSSVDDAVGLLAEGWRPFAGGTDLMVLMNAGRLPARRYFSIWHLRELRGIAVGESEVMLGSLTTYTDLLRDPTVVAEFPNLACAAMETGAEAIRNRGTLGGNIVNASPAADAPPALLTYDAEVELLSASGVRRVKYDGFHTGYKEMVIRPDELLTRIFLPRPLGRTGTRVHYYRKVGTRRAQAISKVVMAGSAFVNGDGDGDVARDVRIAFGSVAPTVVRCHRTEEVLSGGALTGDVMCHARVTLRSEIAPIDDVRSNARYRLRVAENLLEEFMERLRQGGRRLRGG